MKLKDLREQKPVVLLDGAMGTELQRRGVRTTLPLWTAPANLDNTDLVRAIHSEYIEAGADIITTNTFRTTGYAYEKVGRRKDAEAACRAAIDHANNSRQESGKEVLIAGSITTLEDCYEPESVPNEAILLKEHSLQFELLLDQNIDLLLLETFNKLSEISVVTSLAKEANIPVLLSIVTNEDGDLLSGEPLYKAAELVEQNKLNGFMLNCRTPQTMDNNIQKLNEVYGGLKGIYANGIGEPHDELGWVFNGSGEPEAQYRKHVSGWINAGFSIIGGCCGTTPDYIRSIKELIK